jgi:hypothetical protein
MVPHPYDVRTVNTVCQPCKNGLGEILSTLCLSDQFARYRAGVNGEPGCEQLIFNESPASAL